ncbi:MAG: HD domain-containing protein [Candidatus Saccharibacteria bacterium]|nr:HD domain-containing protein [Candidatus Saccharibacteria bacterium]
MAEVYEPNLDRMFTFLRGRLIGLGWEQSIKALAYARKAHAGQFRDGGAPYLIHPVSMACDAIACKGATDNLIATILLHDVVEDCGKDLSALPVNDVVKQGVRYMTVEPLFSESKEEAKKRYFSELLLSPEAVLCKAFDRNANLNDMSGFEKERVAKNVIETHTYLMPVLREAKNAYPEYADMFHIIRTNLKRTIKLLADRYEIALE